jgi:hypothetical protein
MILDAGAAWFYYLKVARHISILRTGIGTGHEDELWPPHPHPAVVVVGKPPGLGIFWTFGVAARFFEG